jgi:hypothetical protein
MNRYEDPKDPYNSDFYWTGKPCVEMGCEKPAGTYWSRLWCFDHNVKRMRRIDKSLEPFRHVLDEKSS